MTAKTATFLSRERNAAAEQLQIVRQQLQELTQRQQLLERAIAEIDDLLATDPQPAQGV